MAHRAFIILAACVVTLGWPASGVAQESVATAQTLYASASYDEALAVIDRLSAQQLTPSEVLVLNQQRALCLLALGRDADAEAAIAAVVQADPTYRPDASPRVRQAFRDVRTRMLPEIVQAEYAEGRQLYDAQAWAESAAQFARVVALASDSELSESQAAALADLKVLAEGFRTLAAKAAEPPPPPPELEPAPEPEPAAPAPPPIDYDAIFDGTEPGVAPPVTLQQGLPRWTGPGQIPRSAGLLEVVIGKNGIVETATMKQRTTGFYDRQILEAVATWKYEPAHLNGQPVRFRKTIKITFQ